MSDLAGESSGGFELRLLEELKLLVEAPRPAAEPGRRRLLPRSRLVLALVVVGLVVGATAASIGAWRLAAKDPRKAAIVSTLQRGGHLGALVTSSGRWSLYAQRRPAGPVDWELASHDETVAGRFTGRRAIEVSHLSADSGLLVLAGKVNAPHAASVALLLPGGRRIPVPVEQGLFLVSLSPAERHPSAVLALDAAGKVVARARP